MSMEGQRSSQGSTLAVACALAALAALGSQALADRSPQPTWVRAPTETAQEREVRARALVEAQGGTGLVVRVDGAVSPELFMPWELFNTLIQRGYFGDSGEREAFRTRVVARMNAWAEPEDLWPSIEGAAGPLLDSLRRQHQIAAGLPPSDTSTQAHVLAELQQIQAGDCAARRTAMDVLIDHWGEGSFRRLLYEGVAPELVIDADPGAESSARLQFVEEGCK